MVGTLWQNRNSFVPPEHTLSPCARGTARPTQGMIPRSTIGHVYMRTRQDA